jgi:hypothetical protein
MDSEFLSDMLSGRVSMDVRAISERIVFTKSTHWAYEQEWRIWSGDGRNPEAEYEDIHFASLELTGVILGCRMPNAERAAFAEEVIALYPRAQLHKAVLAPGAFAITIQPFLPGE